MRFRNRKLSKMLSEWNDPRGTRTVVLAAEIINELQIELAGKISIIKVLHDDLSYYRKDLKDQMIQDQGL